MIRAHRISIVLALALALGGCGAGSPAPPDPIATAAPTTKPAVTTPDAGTLPDAAPDPDAATPPPSIACVIAAAESLHIRDPDGHHLPWGLRPVKQIRFAPGSATLSPEAEPRLRFLVELARAYPPARFEVGGHRTADERRRLSQQRAAAVYDALVALGVDPRAIERLDHGASRPIADPRSEQGARANPRAEVILDPTWPPLPDDLVRSHCPAAPVEAAPAPVRDRIPDGGHSCVRERRDNLWPCWFAWLVLSDPALEQLTEEKSFEIIGAVDRVVGRRKIEQRPLAPERVEQLRARAEKAVRRVLGPRASKRLERLELEIDVEARWDEPPEL